MRQFTVIYQYSGSPEEELPFPCGEDACLNFGETKTANLVVT